MTRDFLRVLTAGEVDDEQVRSLVEGASQAMLILDAAARILVVNQRASAMLDIEPARAVGHSFVGFLAPRDRDGAQRRLRSALVSGQAPEDMRVALRAEGAHAGMLTFLPFRTRAGERIALLLRAGAEDAGAARNERDRKLAELGELLSSVAHELRTPATCLQNLAALHERNLVRFAQAHPGAEEELRILLRQTADMRESAARMNAILHELQPLARNQPPRRADVDLADLARDAVASFRGATAASTVIELDLQSTHPVSLDRREMVRVVINLLRNACDAMDGGGRIWLRTRNQTEPPTIRVEDEGPGVPPDVAARLFEPFFTTKEDGTGLGLVICRRIVENHGGTLTYEPNTPRGAAFVVRFPGAR